MAGGDAHLSIPGKCAVAPRASSQDGQGDPWGDRYSTQTLRTRTQDGTVRLQQHILAIAFMLDLTHFQDDLTSAANGHPEIPVPTPAGCPAPALACAARPAPPATEAIPSPEKKWKDLPPSTAPKPNFANAAALCKSPGKQSVPRLVLVRPRS